MSEAVKDPKVGIVQLYVPEDARPAQQFARAEPLIRSCANDGANLVVLPEMALGMPPRDESKRQHFCKEVDEQIAIMQGLAKDLNIALIPGSYDEAVYDVLGNITAHHNTTCYITPSGEIRSRYRKVNLWGAERLAFKAGDSHTAVDTPFGKIGLLICWDLAFPEAFRCLIKQNVRMIIIPTHWKRLDCGEKGLQHSGDGKSEKRFIDSVICARAYEQNCAVVFCNTGSGEELSQEERDQYFGSSQITMPFKGRVLAMEEREGYIVHKVEFGSVLKDAEDVWNIREDVKRAEWYPVQS